MNLGSLRRARRARIVSLASVLMAVGLGVASTSASAQSATISATFTPGANLLSVDANNANNEIVISRDAAGVILVNNGAVPIVGGAPTVANTALIRVLGQGGDDSITLDESNGALPAAELFGGNGSDTLTGGSGADRLFGENGSDTLLGKGGLDQLFGGDGPDSLTGGDADDQAFGENGNDRMIWNPGDDTDLNEGGDGNDTVEVIGGGGAETFTVAANGPRVRFDRVNPAPFSIDIGTSENLLVSGNGGDDTISAGTGLADLIKITMDGGAGNDTLNGGDGADLMLGGEGIDTIDGNRGDDEARMGAGDDVFIWDPGDGSDVVEGEADRDRMRFNGAGANENIDISSRNNGRLRFFRDVASITMDLNDVEAIDFNALGGADTIVVNDLTRDTEVVLNLESAIGSGVGDGQVDRVILHGSPFNDNIEISGSGTSYSVAGLAAAVSVVNSEPTDQLEVLGARNNDRLDASTLQAGVVQLTLDGGQDEDTLLGSRGVDVLLGGNGDDTIDGNQANDTAFMGGGRDTFIWDPGDGSDAVEGQNGQDTLLFNGAGANENIDVSANGPRVRFFRDVANITMDLGEVENVTFNALGGADTVVVNDLSGTDGRHVLVDLRASTGFGDEQVDSVIVNGTANDDVVRIAQPSTVVVRGLQPLVEITGNEAGFDQLRVNGLGGHDRLNADDLFNGNFALVTLDGGADNDRLVGHPGNDLLDGGDGEDTAINGETIVNVP